MCFDVQREVGLELFRQCVLCGGGEIGSKGAAVCVRTVDGILALLQKERLGELVNSSLIKCLLRMLSDLHVSTILQVSSCTCTTCVPKNWARTGPKSPMITSNGQELVLGPNTYHSF